MRAGFKGSIVRQNPAGNRSVHAGTVRDLNSCRAELNRVMQAVAVVGSIVNALEKRSAVAVDLDGLIRFLPTHRLNAVEMTQALIEGGVEQRICADVLSICNQLYLCAELTKNYATGAFGGELGLAPVAHAWRQLAEACLTVDRMFARALAARGPAAAQSARLPHCQLLAAVSAGLSPCVDERGAIVAPGWAERRVHQRIADVEIPVEICAGGEWRPGNDLGLLGSGLWPLGIDGTACWPSHLDRIQSRHGRTLHRKVEHEWPFRRVDQRLTAVNPDRGLEIASECRERSEVVIAAGAERERRKTNPRAPHW